MASSESGDGPPDGPKARWTRWRNRILSSPRFQSFAAAFPLTRQIARKRAARQFHLVSGFVQSQILYATVTSGLIALLDDDPKREADIAEAIDLDGEPLQRLLKGAAAIRLVEPLGDGWWTLGSAGAELSRNEGALAMIAHHDLLYRDLADPIALLRDGRGSKGALAAYWDYDDDQADAAPYSALMAASQAMVHEQVAGAYAFEHHSKMLDVGAGSGAFIRKVAEDYPELRFGHADLPKVSAIAQASLAELGERVTFHPLDFHDDPPPDGYDLVTLVRILHDHDDAEAQQLLSTIAASLPKSGRLLIAEPMAATKGAEAMGDAYFGFYLWAMGRGRPRTREEMVTMLRHAGLKGVREVKTRQPLIARILVAEK